MPNGMGGTPSGFSFGGMPGGMPGMPGGMPGMPGAGLWGQSLLSPSTSMCSKTCLHPMHWLHLQHLLLLPCYITSC